MIPPVPVIGILLIVAEHLRRFAFVQELAAILELVRTEEPMLAVKGLPLEETAVAADVLVIFGNDPVFVVLQLKSARGATAATTTTSSQIEKGVFTKNDKKITLLSKPQIFFPSSKCDLVPGSSWLLFFGVWSQSLRTPSLLAFFSALFSAFGASSRERHHFLGFRLLFFSVVLLPSQVPSLLAFRSAIFRFLVVVSLGHQFLLF